MEKRNTAKERIMSLVLTMSIVSLLIASAAISILYNVSFEQQKLRLIETIQSQASLIEAIARHDMKHKHDAFEESFEDTIGQLRDAHENYVGFGKTGEFVLATIEDDHIKFLLSHRHATGPIKGSHSPPMIPMGSDVAIPIQKALLGEEGAIVDVDYRGEKVLAAFQLVKLGETRLAIVAKIDLSEIRAPFIEAGVYTTLFAVLVVLIGTNIFIRIGAPLIRQMEESELRLSKITNSSSDAIIMINSMGKIRFWNPAAEKMFGFTFDDVYDKNLEKFIIPPRYREKHLEGLKPFALTGKGNVVDKTLEISAIDKFGREFPIELSIASINLENNWHAVGTISDISERVRAKEELQRAHDLLEHRVVERTQELTRSNEELKDFAYIVSHDLKAPLRAISSLATWIAADYEDKLDDDGKENLQLLVSRTRRMNELIEGILHYSRLGRVKPELMEINCLTLVQETIESLNCPENVTITIDGELPKIVYDKAQIRQLFQNLISNAIAHMDKPEGKITVGCEDFDKLWKFSVKDNGVGIDTRHFDRIFKIFQSLKPRDEKESTGIGLALVRKIVELNGGLVWVESSVGVGSTFYFTIPKGIKVTKAE
ncbi:MAG: PAS domain S-box protein [Nitrospinota bacterium]|nr:PAS domain S-box protein [Nitrospinota bacterium]